jgi:hypothetical protein
MPKRYRFNPFQQFATRARICCQQALGERIGDDGLPGKHADRTGDSDGAIRAVIVSAMLAWT